ncbi:MAG TPA: Gfo/Idh/MocA family oxidoreductase [Flavisolibacter sp.]|nr:Gfo/Idh/MocA family oxidoreductase [Flavisolibacter sp.]
MINWGIIGCGDVTEVKSGPAFNRVDNSRLLAVMRRDAVKAEDYARRHAVPRWYSDADALIGDPEVNAIYIATPPLYHKHYALRAIAAGKAVYVEKPMAMNAAEADQMQDAAAKAGVPLSVAHYRRQQPLFLKIRSLLQEKVLGRIHFINLKLYQPHRANQSAPPGASWRIDPAVSGGGLFHDLAPHQLDLLLYFFGRPRELNGIALNRGGHYEAADTVLCQALFNDGIVFNGLWSFGAEEIHSADVCEIVGDRGSISFAVFEHQRLLLKTDEREEQFIFEKLPHVQEPMIACVVRYFSGLSPNPCTGEDGTIVMEMIDKITSGGSFR